MILQNTKEFYPKNYHIQRENECAAKYRLKRRTTEVLKTIKRYATQNQLTLLDIETADSLMLNNLIKKLI